MTKRKPPGEKLKIGRPTSYRAAHDSQAYDLCLLGATDESLAELFGVCASTIDAWKKTHPGFMGSITRGKTIADAKVAKALFERACGYEHVSEKVSFDAKSSKVVRVPITVKYPPDIAACLAWLRKRRPDLRRDGHDLEVAGRLGEPVTVTVINYADEIAAKIRSRLCRNPPQTVRRRSIEPVRREPLSQFGKRDEF